jgi:magnesium-transporting ATPase (P-type)
MKGWRIIGNKFVMDWKMLWQEIFISFMIAGFVSVFSDLMVPPLVRVNAKYYGWRVALFIAGIMYVSIVITALLMHSVFSIFDILPESSREIESITQFKLDYTFWMNIVFAVVTLILIYLSRMHHKLMQHENQLKTT